MSIIDNGEERSVNLDGCEPTGGGGGVGGGGGLKINQLALNG